MDQFDSVRKREEECGVVREDSDGDSKVTYSLGFSKTTGMDEEVSNFDY